MQDEAEEEYVDQGMVIKETQVLNVRKAYETSQRRRQSPKLWKLMSFLHQKQEHGRILLVGGSGVAATLPLLLLFCWHGETINVSKLF